LLCSGFLGFFSVVFFFAVVLLFFVFFLFAFCCVQPFLKFLKDGGRALLGGVGESPRTR